MLGEDPTPSRWRVYIAGPYTRPDPGENTHKAMRVWDELWEAGFVPFCPHLAHFLHLFRPRPYEEWLDYDLEWLQTCHALLRMPGESAGADREVEAARTHFIPVFDSIEELIEWGKRVRERQVVID